MGTAVKYDLSMPRNDFDTADLLVRSAYRGNKLSTLNLITQDVDQLDPESKAYVLDTPDALGVTFQDKEHGTFDVWLSPNYTNWRMANPQDTLLHELTHGYLGCYNHGQRFRRFLGRVLHHYQELVDPDFTAASMASHLVYRYSRGDSFAYKELEIRSYEDSARREHDYVARTMFKEMRNAEVMAGV